MSWLWQLGRLHTSNVMDKDNKKKTLTISSNLKKKIDTTQVSTGTKKSFSVKKREPFKGNKSTHKPHSSSNHPKSSEFKNKNFTRKFI